MNDYNSVFKKHLCFASLMVVSISYQTAAQSQDETLLAQALERFRIAMVQPDSVVLADLASEDLEYVHSSGTVRNKKDFIDEFIKRWTDVTNVTISDQTIRITGDNAIVRHRLVADSKKAGYPPVIDIIVLMVWRKENGRWKMLARQAAKIPGK
ncbi:MAG: nuclear transport factor 2 family protein [Cyclobacteriaceae bacterium]|nr:nuclear transport factor 2 family protein [Cyclobacteriaceae bacterium]MDH5249215.1 nuclear transport factor 2 family protein [Cyclobacteriaceae bacterium]